MVARVKLRSLVLKGRIIDNVTHDAYPSAKTALEAEQTYSPDGVDLTLMQWMLSLTPAERLQTLQQTLWSIMKLRGDETEA
jgi:hypothetical protein